MPALLRPGPTTRVIAEARRRHLSIFASEASPDPEPEQVVAATCLWPAPYCEDSPDGLAAFLHDLVWTNNDAEREVQQLPWLPHIEQHALAWSEVRRTGSELINLKSRRIVISWTDRACMLWAMGLMRERRIIAGITKDRAGLHVDRLAFIYSQIRTRNPNWQLPLARAYELQDVTGLLILPNGSRCERVEQDHKKLQGEGYAGVHIEEGSMFRRPDKMLAQAKFVTQGSANAVGGMQVMITNADPNPYWQMLKPKVRFG